MNKNIFKFLFPIFFALLAFSQNAGASFSSSSSVCFVASIQFAGPVVIHENYATKVLNNDFFTVGGSITFDPDSTIHSVNVEYVYNSTQPAPAFSPFTFPVAGFSIIGAGVSTYSAVVSGVSLNSGTVFYRIVVNDSGAGGPTYSPWYVLYNPKIEHREIERISEFDRILVATGSFIDNAKASHGKNAVLTLEYYFDSDSSNITVHDIFLTGNNFMSHTANGGAILNIPQGVQTVNYRIAATYGADAVKYHKHTGGWTAAALNSSASAVIGAAGGTLILQNADQRYGDASVYVAPNALQNDTPFTFSERSLNAAYPWPSATNIARIYEVDTLANADFAVTLFGDGENANYIMKYWNNFTSLWENLNTTKQNNGTYLSQGYAGGYYVLALKSNTNRPTKRAFMPGSQTVFENLNPGDSVAIYNLKGKLVKKLTHVQSDGAVRWDGKNENGNYVESGSYVYQIRINGRIISGTIAFVR